MPSMTMQQGEEISAGGEEIATSAEELARSAQELIEQVARFKV